MMEEQAEQKTAAVDAQGTQKTILEEDPSGSQEQPGANLHAVAHVEL
jgi:hypothetical protein